MRSSTRGHGIDRDRERPYRDRESDQDRDRENPTLSRHHGGPKRKQVDG